MEIFLASESHVKAQAIFMCGHDAVAVPHCVSGVPEQPVGRAEILKGAMNRLKGAPRNPVISMESGFVEGADMSCVVLRTRHGVYISWMSRVFHLPEKVAQWRASGRGQSVTIGSFYECSTDWYVEAGHRWGRIKVLSVAVARVLQDWKAVIAQLKPIPARCFPHRDVDFLDVQDSLITHPRELMDNVEILSRNLMFDAVMLMDARGFLFAGAFMQKGISIIMARKPGKLPNEGPSVEYKKEYGADSICVTQGAMKKGQHVLVVDDLVATGGTIEAAKQLIAKHGAVYAGSIAPYAVLKGDGMPLFEDPLLRFVQGTQEQSYTFDFDDDHCQRVRDVFYVAPPSLLSLVPPDANLIEVEWKRFHRSPYLWFPKRAFASCHVKVLLDFSNPYESMALLQLLKILHKKRPESVEVIIPFLEQSTQDRVEYKPGWESMAMSDTVSRMLGNVKTVTFDIHAEQTHLVFRDMECISLVETLYRMYAAEHPGCIVVFPDDGAKKRFGHLVKKPVPVITFRKKRVQEARIIATDDAVEDGGHYVIVDDLVRSGGTMRAVAEYLCQRGALKVDALFAHAPFEPKTAANLDVFDDVWTTNTCPATVPAHWVKLRCLR